MNRKQKICLWAGITAIVVMGLFPPWVCEVNTYLGTKLNHTTTAPGPYSWIGDPPETSMGDYRGGVRSRLYVRAKFVDLYRLGIQYFCVAVVTAGLIIILRNKKVLDGQKQKVVKQKQKVVNLKRGLKRLTLSLAIVAAIASAALGVNEVQEEYERSHIRLPDGFILDKPNMNIQEFRHKYPEYNDLGDTTLSHRLHQKYYSQIPYKDFTQQFGVTAEAQGLTPEEQRELEQLELVFGQSQPITSGNLTPVEANRLAELEAHFGVEEQAQPEEPFSTMELVGLCFLAGLGWGVAGFSAIWVGYLIVWLLCMFIRWLVLGFRDNNRLRSEKP